MLSKTSIQVMYINHVKELESFFSDYQKSCSCAMLKPSLYFDEAGIYMFHLRIEIMLLRTILGDDVPKINISKAVRKLLADVPEV